MVKDVKKYASQTSIYLEGKVSRIINFNLDDETLISLYHSIPYKDGNIPFKSYTEQ